MEMQEEAVKGAVRPVTKVLDVAIIGAGFAGLCMGIQLKKAGLTSFAIFESADDVGGTWRDNLYPGCACDVPSLLYSYSFAPHHEWSHSFSPQPEILSYIKRCVAQHELMPFVHLGVAIERCVFDDVRKRWSLTTRRGETIVARLVVSATGLLREPNIPEFPGQSLFRGKRFHSARWRHDLSLDGKRIAVIGTGASTVQFLPETAPKASQLKLFQRTPPWILPKDNLRFGRLTQRLFAAAPWVQRLLRYVTYVRWESRVLAFTAFPWILRMIEWQARHFIRQSLLDPALREVAEPDYRLGCKRILLSNDYYPALALPQVEVVTAGIERFTEQGIITQDGAHHEVDVVIYGTGFRATDFVAPMEVVGRKGEELSQVWRTTGEIASYLGLVVSGFPNFFLLTGPNTGLGHNSVILMIEAQVHFVLNCLKGLLDRGKRSLEVKPASQRKFGAEMQRRLNRTVWQSGCRSWYHGDDGQIFTLWPGSTLEYWWRTRRLLVQDFLWE